MREKLVILGAGGHGRVVADAALRMGYREVIFLDDGESAKVEISGKTKDYQAYINDCDLFVAIGNSAVRARIMKELTEGGASLATVVHPAATVGARVTLGEGTVVMAGAVVNADARIGRGVILNTSSSVEHR